MQDQIIAPEDWGQVNIDLPRVIDIEPAVALQDGDGHTFRVAVQIARCTADFELYAAWMREWNRRCKPPWSATRIEYKIRQGWLDVYGDENCEFPTLPEGDLPRVKTSRVSFRALDKVAFGAKGAFAELLDAASRMAPLPPLEEIIDRIYPGNPLLCRAATSQMWARTAPRESIRGVEKEFEWLVPSPMSKVTGYAPTTRNFNSYRCIGNRGQRVYIVIEFDFGKTFQAHLDAWAKKEISGRDVQAALIRLLATSGEPRAWPFLIVDSGGKSLHSWFQISKKFTEQNALDLLARAIPFGADKKADEPERFFRFPGGTRKSENNQPQTILFYDPAKLV